MLRKHHQVGYVLDWKKNCAIYQCLLSTLIRPKNKFLNWIWPSNFLIIFCINSYQTQVWSFSGLVNNSLTPYFCSELIGITLAVEYANAKLVDIGLVTDVRVNNRLMTAHCLATAWQQFCHTLLFGQKSELACPCLVWSITMLKALNTWVHCNGPSVGILSYWHFAMGIDA